jgi:cell division protein FtsI (penicillin-binding protein 3)
VGLDSFDNENEKDSRDIKIPFIYIFVFLCLVLFFIGKILFTISSSRDLPSTSSQKSTTTSRASIITKDGFHIAISKSKFTLSLNNIYIDKDKEELFFKLLSIYSKLDIDYIKEKYNSKRGFIIISDDIDSKTAKNLKELSRKLYKLGVYKAIYSEKLGRKIYQGLSIDENGEQREYPYDDYFSPMLGYTQHKKEKIVGINGLEKFYNQKLKAVKNGFIKGQRDISSNIIFNGDSIVIPEEKGYDLHLNTSLKLQKRVSKILSKYKEELEAKEIIATVMESSSGAILSMASSNRYLPNNIKQDQLRNLTNHNVQISYEAGSVNKPILLAHLLDKKLLDRYEIIKGYKGRYKIGRKTITDTHPMDFMSAEDIIVHSSNIGIAQLSLRLSGQELHDMYKNFGFGEKTGIDLPFESTGLVPSVKRLNNDIYKATVSYGYSIRTSFIQMLNAYNVFNNHGRVNRPKVVSYLDGFKRIVRLDKLQDEKQVIEPATAKIMKQILVKTVQKGTGRGTIIDGLEIGGKTGTAHVAEKGKYVNKYVNSFFGFANDKKNNYTIGVTVFEPTTKTFASQTAVPVFKEIVEELLKLDYLKIEKNIDKK